MTRKKRSRTVWLDRVEYRDGTYIRVGRVYNSPDVPADIIRWQVESASTDGSHDFACTVDEALAFVACLSGALAREMLPKSAQLRRMFH